MFGWNPSPFQKFLFFVLVLPFLFLDVCIKKAKEFFIG
jgi:hypothetical protein